MKPPKGLDELLKLLINEGIGETDDLMQEIGVISKELIAEMNQIDYDMEDMKDEIHRKMEDYSKKLEREYAPRVVELDRRDKECWASVYKEVGSNGKGKHSLNRKTGVITRQVDVFK